ncbi:MAG: AlkA N-terminal domain-containing protein [Candidatus Eremiobacterota bacterium]
MLLEGDTCYDAMRTRDPRFDGRFFVGVSSTGIYCRPVCTVKAPRRENCTFYPSAAAAEGAGFRPCLRCRPEQAPGNASVDSGPRLALAAAALIEEGFLEESSLEGLAARLGVTPRHLRRVFAAEFGVAPSAYALTQRLLLARRLLADTDLPTTEVALASGFRSLRRFHAAFRERYRVRPGELRRNGGVRGELSFQLGFRPPYSWDAMLVFLADRCVDGVEQVEGDLYRRTVALPRGSGWVSVQPGGPASLRVTLSPGLSAAVPAVLTRVKRLFDLTARPDEIAAGLGPLVRDPGLRLPGAFDGFEMAVRAVLGQQVTVRAARTLAGRLTARVGRPLDTPFPGLHRTFPSPSAVAEADLDGLGIVGARCRSIRALAQAAAEGRVRLEPVPDLEREMDRLRELPGFGEWTVQVVAMRALAWPDAFPHTDLGVVKALGTRSPRAALEAAERWRPWRAYATLHLWRQA